MSAVLGTASVSHADVVTDWNTAALNAIRGNRTAPPIASRALAILHASMYDAVNGIMRTHEAYLVPSDVPASASPEAAATALGALVGSTRTPAGYMEVSHTRSANEDALTAGFAIGEWAATHVMQPKANRSRK